MALSSEKVLIVVVDFKKRSTEWTNEEILNEMKELVSACGAEVVEGLIFRESKPTASHLIGRGKVEEVTALCGLKHVDTVIFSVDIKGSQQRNLEESWGVKVIDRTQLILDIFARHASSLEGKMQVELAQLEYLLPRLVGKGVALSRLGGGIGTLGPGETKLEVDRRRIGQRIAALKKKLKDVAADRSLKRKKRTDQGLPSVSLAGYTNAGKSTLLNLLTEAGQTTRNGLFTTLDSLSRQMTLPNKQKIIVSDTVGFMHELPHHLIESFKATLEEVIEADIILHVLDISHPHFRHLRGAVLDVLKQLNVSGAPVITVLNKIDQLTDRSWLADLEKSFSPAVALSAKTGEGLPALLAIIEDQLASFCVEIERDIPLNHMDLVHLAHKEGQVLSVKYYDDHVYLRAVVPARVAGRLADTDSQ